MPYPCDVVAVPPVLLAVTDAQTKQAEIPSRIPAMFDIVYAWLRNSGVEQTGQTSAALEGRAQHRLGTFL